MPRAPDYVRPVAPAPAMRYLGSKSGLASAILDVVGDPVPGSAFVDALAGTGAVAREAAIRGWRVRVNDSLHCASRIAQAAVIREWEVPFHGLGGYGEAIVWLNRLKPIEGFVVKAFTPASARYCAHERKYFTTANGGRIDAARTQIAEWENKRVITRTEAHLLTADLLAAASQVANTCGTFAAFRPDVSRRATRELTLRPRSLLIGAGQSEAYAGDAAEVPVTAADVVYLDPPYNTRQYASYYHVLETIARGDAPVLTGRAAGVTGNGPGSPRRQDRCQRLSLWRRTVQQGWSTCRTAMREWCPSMSSPRGSRRYVR